jgi:DNA-3-methyladenine glycosylase II
MVACGRGVSGPRLIMDAATILHLSNADPMLGRLMGRVGPSTFKPHRGRTPYEALVRAVANQQLSGKAAETILGRFVALFPGEPFPRPEDLAVASEERLRSAGFSRAKCASIKEIAAKTLEGIVPTRRQMAHLTDEEIVERLTTIRGVGRWTVEMLLIFTLARPNVLPVHDLGVRKGFALAYGLEKLPAPEELLERGRVWEPFRTTASWYFWRALELPAQV